MKRSSCSYKSSGQILKGFSSIYNCVLLKLLISSLKPDRLLNPFSLFGTVIIRTAYGFDDIRQNESLVHVAEKFITELTETLIPGRFLVNNFPILRYIPSWFPGASFQRHFKSMAEMSFQQLYPPFEEAKHNAVSVLQSIFWLESRCHGTRRAEGRGDNQAWRRVSSNACRKRLIQEE